MTDNAATTRPIGGLALLERAINFALGSLRLVEPADLSAPTPCRDWDLESLLAHMNDSVAALHEAIDTGRVGLAPVADTVDPVDALRAGVSRLLGAWTNAQTTDPIWVAGHPLLPSVISGTGAIELAVHGWDVARACGRSRAIPPTLAEELLGLLPLLVSEADRPERFAAPVVVGAMAGPGDRLVAHLGRRPY